MTNLIAVMQTSAYTLDAQTILPSSTLPSHASMLTGMCPSKHAVYWNDYVPENGYALGTDLFDIAHAAGLRTVMIVGKEKLRQITEPASTDVFIFKEADLTISNLAIAEIKTGLWADVHPFSHRRFAGTRLGLDGRRTDVDVQGRGQVAGTNSRHAG